MNVKLIENTDIQTIADLNSIIDYNNSFTTNVTALENIKKLRSIKSTKIVEMFIKRFADILGGIVGVFLLAPITIFVYVVKILYKDKDSMFFCQERIGKDGNTFKMYKYRTMIQNADKELEKYLEQNEQAKEEYEKYKKIKDDPRVTKIGKILRKTSLDEFPQFINVLKGEMSLVGPRPYLPKEQKQMGIYYEYITKNKPGITGPWQCGGRNLIPFKDRLNIDFDYYCKSNIVLDFKLLMKTVLKVFIKEGAN